VGARQIELGTDLAHRRRLVTGCETRSAGARAPLNPRRFDGWQLTCRIEKRHDARLVDLRDLERLGPAARYAGLVEGVLLLLLGGGRASVDRGSPVRNVDSGGGRRSG